MNSLLERFMPYGVDDPLRTFCERMSYPHGFSLGRPSKWTHFYHCVKAIKKHLNIKEDKLIVTLLLTVFLLALLTLIVPIIYYIEQQ